MAHGDNAQLPLGVDRSDICSPIPVAMRVVPVLASVAAGAEAAPSVHVTDGSGVGLGVAFIASLTDMVSAGVEVEHYRRTASSCQHALSLVALGCLAGTAVYIAGAMLQAAK